MESVIAAPTAPPPGWFTRPGDRTGRLHYWDGTRWTGATLTGDGTGKPRPVRAPDRPDPAAVLTACIVAVVAVAGFVALVITLKGGIAAVALLLVLVPAWFSWRRRRAARRRRR